MTRGPHHALRKITRFLELVPWRRGLCPISDVDAMSIEILSTEISWKTDLATWGMFLNSVFNTFKKYALPSGIVHGQKRKQSKQCKQSKAAREQAKTTHKTKQVEKSKQSMKNMPGSEK